MNTACTDCGLNVQLINEYAYVVRNSVWYDAGKPPQDEHAITIIMLLYNAGVVDRSQVKRHLHSGGMLCIGCIETRLGRELTLADFKPGVMLNAMGEASASPRLMSRLRGWTEYDSSHDSG